MLKISIGGALFLLLAIAAPFRAAVAVDSVDFPHAVDRALTSNPDLSAAGYDYAATRQDVGIARGRYLPEVGAGMQFVRTSIPAEVFAFTIDQGKLTSAAFQDVNNFNNPSPRNEYQTSFTLRQPIFAPQAYLGYRLARGEAEAKGYEYSRTREETVYKVLLSYLDVLTAKSYAAVAAQGLADAKEHQRLAEAAEKAGTGLSADVLRAKVAVAAAEGEKVTAESRLELARRGLSLAMGEGNAPPVDAADPPPAFPETGSLEELQSAAAKRGDLRADSKRAENAGTGVAIRKSEYLPNLGFLGAYQLDSDSGPFSGENRSWKVGVGLSWNLFDGLRRESEISRAASERRKAEEYSRSGRDRAAYQVAEAYLGVREAQRRSEIAAAAVGSAEEGVRLIRIRYENQLGRMIDVLDAQTALDRARAEAVKAKNDVSRSRARLLFASGTLLEWAVPEGKERRP